MYDSFEDDRIVEWIVVGMHGNKEKDGENDGCCLMRRMII